MVKGSFSKVLAEPRLLKLNFGIMCLHILLINDVCCPAVRQLADAGSRRLNTGRSIWRQC